MRHLLLVLLVACGGRLPETRFYQLALPGKGHEAIGELVVALEPFDTAPGYDDDRIVYRTTPYRLDYYHYHRWSSSPGVMVASFLEQALERSGKIAAVVRDPTEQSQIVIRGRVVAIEEVDESKASWLGRIAIELTVTEARTGALLWSHQYEESEPIHPQNPEGLARSLSVAMTRICHRATPTIIEAAERLASVRASLAKAR